MRIKDRPEFRQKPRPITLPPTAVVHDAARVMAEHNYGSVVVVNADHTVAGIVTERDLLRRLLAKSLNAHETTLSEIMTAQVRVAREDDNLIDWLRQMSNERFRHLPVVDADGKVVSMMSQGDFVSYTWPELLHRVSETAKATIAPNYQVATIVAAVLLYAVAVPIVFNLI